MLYRAPRPCSRKNERKRERPPQKIIALLIHSLILPNLGPNKSCPSNTIGKATIDKEEDEVEKEKERKLEEKKKKRSMILLCVFRKFNKIIRSKETRKNLYDYKIKKINI